MAKLFVTLLTVVVTGLRATLRSRSDLVLENVALRQQVGALKLKRPRPQLDDADRAFWVAMRRAWSGWAERLVIVKPETVVRWHRERFRRYWSELSRHQAGSGRPRVDHEIRRLVRRMARENDWGAPRVHGELEKLGFTVSEATVSRYMPQRPVNPDVVQRWLSFLRNHSECIAARSVPAWPQGARHLRHRTFDAMVGAETRPASARKRASGDGPSRRTSFEEAQV